MYPAAQANGEDRSISNGNDRGDISEAHAVRSEVDNRWRGNGESPMRCANRLVREGQQQAHDSFRSLMDDNVAGGVHYSPRRAEYDCNRSEPMDISDGGGVEQFATGVACDGDNDRHDTA